MNMIKLILLFLVLSNFNNSKSMEILEGKITPALSIIGTGAVLGATFKYGTLISKGEFMKVKPMAAIGSGICWGICSSMPVACAALIGPKESMLRLSIIKSAILFGELGLIFSQMGRLFCEGNAYIETHPEIITEEQTMIFGRTTDRHACIPNFACIFSSIVLTTTIVGMRLVQK